MPAALRAMALQQGLMVPACKHCRISLGAFSSVSTISSNASRGPALGSETRLQSSSVTLRPSRPLAAHSGFLGWKNFSPPKDLFLVFVRALAGRAHFRAKAVSARVSTSFSTEEAALVERSVQEVGRPATDDGDGMMGGTKLEGNMRKLPGSNIVMDVNMGRRHLIKDVEFIKSSPRESDCPQDGLPEFALVGRSNVGKSSLVNALVNRKEMAQTSKRPGALSDRSFNVVDVGVRGLCKANKNLIRRKKKQKKTEKWFEILILFE